VVLSKVAAVEREQDPADRGCTFELCWIIFAERAGHLNREHIEVPRPQGFD
jgi:hypothetical protein